MKRNFVIHPFNVGYFDVVSTQYTSPLRLTAPDVNLVKYKVIKNQQNDGQKVIFEPVDCAMSNSVSICVVYCRPINANSTVLPAPYNYYTITACAKSRVRPKISLWLKDNKYPDEYILQDKFYVPIGDLQVNAINRVYSAYQFSAEKLNTFDCFQISVDYGTGSATPSIDIIGDLNDGTTANSRNNMSVLNPFTVNTYWVN